MRYIKFFFLIFFVFLLSLNLRAGKKSLNNSLSLDWKACVRTYALNDQRIYWSGVEFSFGSEAVISTDITKQLKWGKIKVESQFFINQPFGRNILTDEGRKKFLPNFSIETFNITKLNIQVSVKHFLFKMGKMNSPFGRYSFPIFNNNMNFGSPFIRAEAINWRETGVLLGYKAGILSIEFAAVNGEENRDTNSSKAGILRIGIKTKHLRLGASMKEQDGYGSEWQKIYKNHKGFDFMLKLSKFEFSGEIIWDEYGFHREFDENEIFWPTSIYYRDIFYKYKTPIKGFGWYSNFKYQNSKFLINLNYGIYIPMNIGNIYHDNTIRRFILKMSYNNNQRVEDIYNRCIGEH